MVVVFFVVFMQLSKRGVFSRVLFLFLKVPSESKTSLGHMEKMNFGKRISQSRPYIVLSELLGMVPFLQT
jgi:hypothetical protein